MYKTIKPMRQALAEARAIAAVTTPNQGLS